MASVSYLNKTVSLWLAFLYGAHESFPTLRDVCMYVCVCACGCSFNMDG